MIWNDNIKYLLYIFSFKFCAIIMISVFSSCLSRRVEVTMRSRSTNSITSSPFQLAKSQAMPSIILCSPYSDANLGSISRSMLNFGFTDLRLVTPHCNPKSEIARQLAVGSVELLDHCQIFESIKDAVEDLSMVVASTSRERDMNLPVLSLEESAIQLLKPMRSSVLQKTGILFGTEKSGLSNEELSHAKSILAIDSYEHYPVLNLAQAVNIICYEIFRSNNSLSTVKMHSSKEEEYDFATLGEVDFYLSRLEKALYDRGHEFQSKNNNIKDLSVEEVLRKREENFRDFKVMFSRLQVTRKELQMNHGMLTTLLNDPNNLD